MKASPFSVDVVEPIRLRDGGGSAYERAMTESAALDVLPGAVAQRLARALSVPAQPSPPAPLGPESAQGGAPSVAQLAGYGAALRGMSLGKLGAFAGLGLLCATSWLFLQRSEQPFAARGEPAPRAAADAVRAALATPEQAPSGAMPDPVAPDSAGRAPTHPAGEAARPDAAPEGVPRAEALAAPLGTARTAPVRRPRPAAAREGLLEEVRLLEQARQELRAGRAAAAERTLGAYHAHFAHGELALEAELLDLDLLVAQGRRERASGLARELLARGGAARYRARLEQLLQQLEAARAVSLPGSNGSATDMDGRRLKP
jgi:hypothetical protein